MVGLMSPRATPPLTVETDGRVRTIVDGVGVRRVGDALLVGDPHPSDVARFDAARGQWWVWARRGVVTAADASGVQVATAGPGELVPIVFDVTTVTVRSEAAVVGFTVRTLGAYRPRIAPRDAAEIEAARSVTLTPGQRSLIIALAEPVLLGRATGSGVPTSAAAATRLGWTLTAFNRKLDNVCDKFDRAGVSGLRGGPGRLAIGRRARLVEIAMAAGLIVATDLRLLPAQESDPSPHLDGDFSPSRWGGRLVYGPVSETTDGGGRARRWAGGTVSRGPAGIAPRNSA